MESLAIRPRSSEPSRPAQHCHALVLEVRHLVRRRCTEQGVPNARYGVHGNRTPCSWDLIGFWHHLSLIESGPTFATRRCATSRSSADAVAIQLETLVRVRMSDSSRCHVPRGLECGGYMMSSMLAMFRAAVKSRWRAFPASGYRWSNGAIEPYGFGVRPIQSKAVTHVDIAASAIIMSRMVHCKYSGQRNCHHIVLFGGTDV